MLHSSDISGPAGKSGEDGYLSETWLDLSWSPWVPFDAPREFFYIPKDPGMYRIRPAGMDFLLYIGETGQPLHKKLAGLRQTLRRADLMPWSSPHPEAPCLWAYWVEWVRKNGIPGRDSTEEPVMLECSAAHLDASAAGRKGMMAFLLYRYRQDCGESPPCNFGRFHPRYRKSTTHAEGRRGGRLMDNDKDNPAGFPAIEPLDVTGSPGDSDWMGLEWTVWQSLDERNVQGVAAGAGLYLLADAGSREIVYIGQAGDIGKKLNDDMGKKWDGRPLLFSYQVIGQSVLPHNLRELETDLLGRYYECLRRAPEFQYRAVLR